MRTCKNVTFCKIANPHANSKVCFPLRRCCHSCTPRHRKTQKCARMYRNHCVFGATQKPSCTRAYESLYKSAQKKLPNSPQEVHVRKRAPAGGKVGAKLETSDPLGTCDRKPRPAHPSGRPSGRNVDTPGIWKRAPVWERQRFEEESPPWKAPDKQKSPGRSYPLWYYSNLEEKNDQISHPGE